MERLRLREVMSFFHNHSAQEQEVGPEPLSRGLDLVPPPACAISSSPRLQFTALGNEDIGQNLPLREFYNSEFPLKIRTHGFHL